MQSTGQTDTHERSITSTQGSAMTYAMVGSSPGSSAAEGRGLPRTAGTIPPSTPALVYGGHDPPRPNGSSSRSGSAAGRRRWEGRRGPERHAARADEADRDDHPLLPVTGDVAADEPAAGRGRGVRRHDPRDVHPLAGADHDPDAIEPLGLGDHGGRA